MRALICILVLFFSFSTVNAQLTINGKISTIPTTYVNTNGKVGTGEGLENSGKKTKTFVCGDDITINHVTTDGVAPVAKTVTYKTVLTTISGVSKCWITSNLGATNEASSATDATDNASGWYWQFNYREAIGMLELPERQHHGHLRELSLHKIGNQPMILVPLN